MMHASKSSLLWHGAIGAYFQRTHQRPTGLTVPQGMPQPVFQSWETPAGAAPVLVPSTQGRAGHVHPATGRRLRRGPRASAWPGPAATEAVRIDDEMPSMRCSWGH